MFVMLTRISPAAVKNTAGLAEAARHAAGGLSAAEGAE
jgi:hypothetical protein